MTKTKMIKQIKGELSNIYDFISAEENSGFGFSLSQAQDRAKYLENKLKDLLK